MVTTCLLTQHDIQNGGTGAPSVVTAGGTWTYVSGPQNVTVGANTYIAGASMAVEGQNPCVTMNTCGDFVFRYTVVGCNTDTALLTATVYEAFIAINSANNCTYTIMAEHPDNATNFWKHEVVLNSKTSISTIDVFVERDCGGVITELDRTLETLNLDWGRIQYSNGSTNGILANGFINFIKVHRDDGTGAITSLQIPLEPGDVIAAGYNNGCAGTVITADLQPTVVNVTTTAALQVAITQVIQNALCAVWAAVEGVDYDSDIAMVGQGSSIGFRIGFDIKHDPTAQWIGIHATDLDIEWDRNGAGTIRTEANLATAFVINSGSKVVSKTTPCGNISANFVVPTNTLYNTTGTSFNFVVPGTASTIIPINDGPNLQSRTCLNTSLTAFACDTCTNATYSWTGPNSFTGSTATVTVQDPGTYTVNITCDELTCTLTESITLP